VNSWLKTTPEAKKAAKLKRIDLNHNLRPIKKSHLYIVSKNSKRFFNSPEWSGNPFLHPNTQYHHKQSLTYPIRQSLQERNKKDCNGKRENGSQKKPEPFAS